MTNHAISGQCELNHSVDAKAGAISIPTEGAAPTRVLIVDDEPDIRRSYARLLARAGIHCELAAEGAEAKRAIERNAPDVIVSDISMPSMSGIELLQAVRTLDADIPVILMTGGPSVETAVRAVELGALQYLLKPVDAAELISAIEEAAWLRRLAGLRRAAVEHLFQQSAERARLDRTLSRAVDALWVAYQPIVSLSERRIVACEALCRSRNPDLPHPGALFEAAEQLGRVHEIGRLIRRLALPALARIPNDVRLFINLHPLDLLDEDLLTVPPEIGTDISGRVVLEVTERSSLEGIGDIGDRISSLKACGYQIAVDDLGAGYAGLSAFAKLSPEVVKIDMSLVRAVDRDPLKARLIASIVGLCRDLGIEVVVEGVETAAERDALVACGCDWMQGYFFARPAAEIPSEIPKRSGAVAVM